MERPAGLIYLEVDDEITSAAARIRAATEPRIAIVLPAGSRISTSRINFRLLSREAVTRHRALSIVAPEQATRSLAASAGLPVFATVTEYEASVAQRPPTAGPEPASGATVPGVTQAEGAAGTADGRQAIPGRGPISSPGTDQWTPSNARPAGRGGSVRRAGPGVIRGGPPPAGGGAPAGQPQPSGPTGGRSGSVTGPGAGLPDDSVWLERDDWRAPSDAGDVFEPEGWSDVEEAERQAGRGSRRLLLTIVAIVVVLVLGVSGAAAYLFLPTATITIRAVAAPIGPLTFTVRADPLAGSSDVSSGVVPASVVSLNLTASGTFPASGKKVSESKAQGRVRWTNCDPTRSYTIPKGVVASTASGVGFITASSVFLPVAILDGNPPTISCQSRDVAVTAQAAGTAGNVAAGAINVVPTDFNDVVIRVTNVDPTQGGTHTETAIVAQKDVDAAETALQAQIGDQLDSQLADGANTPAGSVIFPATASTSSVRFSPDPATLVGEAASDFQLAATATATATAVDQSVVRDLAMRRLDAAVAGGSALVAGSVQITLGTPSVRGPVISYPVRARASEVAPLDATAIRNRVRGLSVDAARALLRDYGNATVEVWPDWVNTITTFDFRLHVRTVMDIPTEAPGAPAPTAPATPSIAPGPSAGATSTSGVPTPSTSPVPLASPSPSEASGSTGSAAP